MAIHSEPRSKSPRVLVVEDDPTTLTVLSAGLQADGFEVSQACNGQDALAHFDRFTPDAVVTDVNMPVMNGYDLIENIRRRAGCDELPILVMTGSNETESIDRAFAVGATDFFSKPVHNTVLAYRVRYMLRASDNLRALRANKRRLSELAYRDPLTDLPNRIAFMDKLDRLITYPGGPDRLAVVSLDLDQFKRINDTLGSAAGDRVICELAKRLARSVAHLAPPERRGHALVARMGGDQFGLQLPIDAEGDPVELAAQIAQTFEEPIALHDNRFFLNATLGVAVYPEHGNDAQSLVRRADAAAHFAKIKDPGAVRLYSDEIEQRSERRMRVEGELRTALATESELVNFYQPKVHARTGAVLGVEALVRWQKPDGSMVFPNDFIPVAEDTGLIVPMGEMVLRMACRQARQWVDAGYRDLQVAVNLSARQFESGELVRTVERALTQSGVDPRLIALEITEGVLIQNPQASAQILHDLRSLGVTLSLDDFGTGYSSLSYLKDFPLDVLKIDRAFVQDLPADRRSAAIANAILQLADDMGLRVVAEGVETEEQLAFFQERDDIEVQGYLFSKPLPAPELEKWHVGFEPLGSQQQHINAEAGAAE